MMPEPLAEPWARRIVEMVAAWADRGREVAQFRISTDLGERWTLPVMVVGYQPFDPIPLVVDSALPPNSIIADPTARKPPDGRFL